MTSIATTVSRTHVIDPLILSILPLTLGFGVYPLMLPAVVIALVGLFFVGYTPYISNIRNLMPAPGFWVFLVLLGLFFVSYSGFYIPYHPNLLKMPRAYFPVLFALSLFTVFCVCFLSKYTQVIDFIWFFCIGALLFCLLTVVATLLLEKAPYYSKVLDVRYLAFGIKKYINTPGISNLLCLFPAVFMGCLLLKPIDRPRFFWVLGLLGLILSVGANIAIGQRSYFVLTLVIEPAVICLFLLLLKKSWRSFLAIFCLIASYPILKELDRALGTALLYRPLNHDLLNDPRFQMLRYWLDHLIVEPFQRVEVGPAPWADLQWFHNFFADVHRLSGFWALLAASILVAYIFLRILFVIKRERGFGLFLMAVAIPCFLIMNTSVVPEAERQPFLLLIAIGAICEVLLARPKSDAFGFDNKSSNPK